MNHTEKRKQERFSLCIKYIAKVQLARNLLELLQLHKEIWGSGLRHPNLGPDPYGMFRTKDISTMSESEVFLGDKYGLWTLSLDNWIESDEEHIATAQYRNHLISNLELIKSLVYDHGLDRKKIERAIAAEVPLGMNITEIKVTDSEMDTLKLMHFNFKVNGIPMQSNLFLKSLSPKDDLLLLPMHWYKGEHVKNIRKIGRISHWIGVGHKDRGFIIKRGFLRKEFTVSIK